MTLNLPGIFLGATADAGLFGGNVLATHGSLIDSAYDDAIEELGVTTLRFPGGSLTEYLFDIRTPNAIMSFDSRTGEIEELITLSEFMEYAETAGNPVTIVIPTRTQLSDRTDANGDRFTDIDAAELRGFVQDVVGGVYGDADVRAFEIGNEYWGSGEMNAAEYGRLASEMSVIVDEALSEVGADQVDVVVQKGNNYGTSSLGDSYGGVTPEAALADVNAKYDLSLGEEAFYIGGQVNWTYVNNEIVLSNFDTEQERDAIDGVVAHVYSRGADNTPTRVFDLENIEESWREEFPDLDVYITEWNLKSTVGLDPERDYGLFQAHEMLNLMEEFMRFDVTEANVWPLIQNTRNALSNGRDFDEATVSGELFAMMGETLPGKTLLDFTRDDDTTTEHAIGDVNVHAFAGEQELAFYIVNTDDRDPAMTDVDISDMVAAFGAADVTLLGVQDGEAAGDNRSTAKVEDISAERVIEDGSIKADLLPGEILQVVFNNVEPTAEFQTVWDIANGKDEAPDALIAGESAFFPTVPVDESGEVQRLDEETTDEEDEGGSFDLGFVFLPLLLLLGVGS